MMSLAGVAKRVVPQRLRPLAISAYIGAQRRYFSLYRSLFRPCPRYVAVAEQNYITVFPPEWTSICIENSDVLVDLETEYNFEFTSVEYAYSGHTIEHLSDAAVKRLFRNLARSMKPGGVIRVECPDLDLLLDDYRCVHNKDRAVTRRMLELTAGLRMPKVIDAQGIDVYAQDHIKLLAGIVSYHDHKYDTPLTPVCSAEEFNEKISTLTNAQFGDWAVSLLTPEHLRDSFLHRNWFNLDKLTAFLTEAGFSEVVRCGPRETHHGFRMNINRTHRAWCSIFVEAIKP
jgi:hypothetical protein